MIFRELQHEDINAVLKLRTLTRENRMTKADLANLGITPESVAGALGVKTKGWVCEYEGRILGFTVGDGDSGEMLVVAVLPHAETGHWATAYAICSELAVFQGASGAVADGKSGSCHQRLPFLSQVGLGSYGRIQKRRAGSEAATRIPYSLSTFLIITGSWCYHHADFCPQGLHLSLRQVGEGNARVCLRWSNERLVGS